MVVLCHHSQCLARLHLSIKAETTTLRVVVSEKSVFQIMIIGQLHLSCEKKEKMGPIVAFIEEKEGEKWA